jgi:hypothetical protein
MRDGAALAVGLRCSRCGGVSTMQLQPGAVERATPESFRGFVWACPHCASGTGRDGVESIGDGYVVTGFAVTTEPVESMYGIDDVTANVLTERETDTLIERELRGRSTVDIAGARGVSRGTVASNHRRAWRKFLEAHRDALDDARAEREHGIGRIDGGEA